MVVILNSVLPVFAMIALGRLLRSLDLTDDVFFRTADRLVYFIFFPVLLFWKIGTSVPGESVDWGLIPLVLAAVFVTFAASLAYARISGIGNYQTGSFVQGCFRFNTYVGLAVIWSSLGEPGVRQFGVTIGFVIPLINVLCVGTLTWYSNQGTSASTKGRLVIKEVVANPLIIACVLGILYSRTETSFPQFLENTFRLMSPVALPLALVSIGGSLSLRGLAGHVKLALVACFFKLVVLSTVGYALLHTFGASDLAWKVGMIYFALPTSPANYILSSQLNSDVGLAAATIVLSVLLSVVSLSVILVAFVS